MVLFWHCFLNNLLELLYHGKYNPPSVPLDVQLQIHWTIAWNASKWAFLFNSLSWTHFKLVGFSSLLNDRLENWENCLSGLLDGTSSRIVQLMVCILKKMMRFGKIRCWFTVFFFLFLASSFSLGLSTSAVCSSGGDSRSRSLNTSNMNMRHDPNVISCLSIVIYHDFRELLLKDSDLIG